LRSRAATAVGSVSAAGAEGGCLCSPRQYRPLLAAVVVVAVLATAVSGVVVVVAVVAVEVAVAECRRAAVAVAQK